MEDAARKGRMTKGERQHAHKLTAEQVKEIRNKFKSGTRRMELAKAYSLNFKTVDGIVKMRAWRHI